MTPGIRRRPAQSRRARPCSASTARRDPDRDSTTSASLCPSLARPPRASPRDGVPRSRPARSHPRMHGGRRSFDIGADQLTRLWHSLGPGGQHVPHAGERHGDVTALPHRRRNGEPGAGGQKPGGSGGGGSGGASGSWSPGPSPPPRARRTASSSSSAVDRRLRMRSLANTTAGIPTNSASRNVSPITISSYEHASRVPQPRFQTGRRCTPLP